MAGPKITGWEWFSNADDMFLKSMDLLSHAKSDYGPPLAEFANACSFTNSALEDGLQELYERIQRLHQKIDRIEAKLGSVPKA